jgi:hypothetical protein
MFFQPKNFRQTIVRQKFFGLLFAELLEVDFTSYTPFPQTISSAFYINSARRE